MQLEWSRRQSVYMLVTPAIARAWLDNNNRSNRPMKRHAIVQYARDMREGNWRETHQGIGFDTNGQLVDGQHRLAAIVESGASASFLVTTGMLPETRLNVDTHAKRTVVDALTLTGRGRVYKHIAPNQVSSFWFRLLHGMESGSIRATRDELAKFVDEHQQCGDWTLSEFEKHARVRRVMVAGVMGAVGRAFYHYQDNLPRLSEFVQVIVTGVPKSVQNDLAAIRWRNTLLAGRMSSAVGGAEVYGKTARTIQAFMDGRDLGKIYTPEEEPFPLPNRAS